jgi:hypothetical protein
MTLTPGTRLGSYTVTTVLGVGGMGEVYGATDANLKRVVALKVLPEGLASDPQRLARFQHEAEVLASLNHPNIAAVYGLERSGGITALVMELVEGFTLADAPPGIPQDQMLHIAAQIAAALEAAHDRGIVHRDLKPANIKVRPDGTVKVLDFGLARVTPTVSPSEDAAPTLTAVTEAGMVLGTPAYMAPEQVRGEQVDKRADIWAFGCVLYEMLTGRQAFDGATTADVVAQVLHRQLDFDVLPDATPASIRRLLHRCLARDRRGRLRDIGDAGLDIREALNATPELAVTPPQRGPRGWVWTAAASVASALVAGGAIWWIGQSPPVSMPLSRFAIAVPQALPLTQSAATNVAMSRDGVRFVYRSLQGLVVRSRDSLDGVSLPRASDFFFSPDGEWIGYLDDRELRKVPVSGGPATTLAEVGAWPSGTWSETGIVIADADGLSRVRDGGGPPEPIPMTPLEPNEQAAFPEVLPGGQTILFTIAPTRGNILLAAMAEAPGVRIEALDVATGARRTLIRGGAAARYVSTGHLLYASKGATYAVAFDKDRLDVESSPVRMTAEPGSFNFAVSSDGSLLYVAGVGRTERTLEWVDRTGKSVPLDAPSGPYVYPQLSPDETRVALVVADETLRVGRDVSILDIGRGQLDPLTQDPSDNSTLAWSPDGSRVAYGSARTGTFDVFWQAADGSGAPEPLLTGERVQMPIRFAADGRLLVSADVPGRARDILALSVDGSQRLDPIIEGPGLDVYADVSPDGQYIAYDSNESGQFEVYIRPYPGSGGRRWRISSAGGRQPLWSSDGGELFYRNFDGAMMAVTVARTPAFAPGSPVKLFDAPGYAGSGSSPSAATYDVGADGRFLMIKEADTPHPDLILVQHWFGELQRLVLAGH